MNEEQRAATARYAVIGNPVAHSKSPQIHAAFAAATARDMEYGRVEAPLDGFAATVERLRGEGYRGVNVTVPFKEEAYHLVADATPQNVSARAHAAGAVNTLRFDQRGLFADNTDGAGLVTDLIANLGFAISERRVLLVGAGGAGRGVLQPLLNRQPAALAIVNRNHDKALALAQLVDGSTVPAGAAGPGASGSDKARTKPYVLRYEELANVRKDERFDLVINATSASLVGALPPLPSGIFAEGALAYDMMYGQGDTPFMAWARGAGAVRVADGLGMLVEQAAEAFLVWRGMRPPTAAVLSMLRSG